MPQPCLLDRFKAFDAALERLGREADAMRDELATVDELRGCPRHPQQRSTLVALADSQGMTLTHELPDPRSLVDVREAAELLQTTPNRLRYLLRTGVVRGVPFPTPVGWRLSRVYVIALAEAHRRSLRARRRSKHQSDVGEPLTAQTGGRRRVRALPAPPADFDAVAPLSFTPDELRYASVAAAGAGFSARRPRFRL